MSLSQTGDAQQRPTDLRLPMLGALAWSTALAQRLLPPVVLVGTGAAVLAWLCWRWRAGTLTATAVGWLVLAGAVSGVVMLRTAAIEESPVTTLASGRAAVTVVLRVGSDPHLTQGRFGSRAMFHATVLEVTGRGVRHRVRAPVLVFGPVQAGVGAAGWAQDWAQVQYGARLAVSGRLSRSDDPTLSALLTVRGPPQVLERPGLLLGAAARLRAGIRDAMGGQAAGPRALVPALVDGDDTEMAADLKDDFRTTGLTHLLAVSGTNLTLVVGFLLILARGVGVRARGLIVVGGLGVAGFVVLTRAEPSVLRAAAMGSVALLGMGTAGRARGTRGLGACVVVLILFDPWLAISPGFTLSALATAGILFLAPPWRDAMMHWMPRWMAEAVAVPLAAQLACTPVVAALSGQVSLVAVAANLFAGVVVGPATVLGLVGGVLAIVWVPLGALVATPAGWCAAWIIAVARHGAGLPMAAGEVSSGAFGLASLTVICVLLALVMARLLARRAAVLGLSAVLVLVMLVPLPTFGWPPKGWVLVACDVGQGDGLVLRASPDDVVVVDTGPDPKPMDQCLRGLGVHRISLVLLTHFHADHIGGLAGVLRGRSVGAIEVSPYADPEAGSRQVHALAAAAKVPVVTAQYGETRGLGALSWQLLAPSEPAPPGSDSPPNDDSVVMLVQTRGVRILMMGDEETGSQERLHELFPGLRVDVLKVAHHGSAKQDPDLIRGLDARVGLISEGKDNDYGHPAPSTMSLLRSAGIRAFRTETDGSIAVVVDGGLRVVTRR